MTGSTAPAGDLAAELLGLGAATLGETGAWRLPPSIAAVWAPATVAAPAYAVMCGSADNLAVHAAVAEAPTGAVLCVGFPDASARGYWGEVLTTGALARGLVGLVIDGGVRDVEALERLGFPVFATGVVLQGATKHSAGSIGATALLGGVQVHTGDWVVGDRDGVAVLPAAQFDEILQAGRDRAAQEDEMFGALRSGRTTVELLGLDTTSIDRGATR